MSKERPILFSPPMVRAVLDGSKTQTRRVVKMPRHMQIEERDDGALWPWMYTDEDTHGDYWMPCPYGQIGDHLWVRENCQAWAYESGGYAVRYPADGGYREIGKDCAEYERWLNLCGYARKEHAIVPSIHMPRWASRILLEITDVRVERLQKISEADAIAEGVGGNVTIIPCFAIARYRALWESINGVGSWDANPWVWVIELKRVLT